MAANIKVLPPQQLPQTGVTPVSFKVWKSTLMVYLSQRDAYRRFLPGGVYHTWTAADIDPDRINALHANDQPVAGPNANQAAVQQAIDDRLAMRRLELETMLSQIASLCCTSDYEDVMAYSINLNWIWTHLEKTYNIEKKGVHFMKLSSITFDKTNGETHVAFYKRLRNHFQDNLRQNGDTIRWKNDQVLTENERLSPTLECTIVFMALKEIDSRLPEYVELVYGHLMTDNTTLMDLQTTIFQAIPRLLTELDNKEAGMNAMYYGEEDEQVDLAAFRGYGGRGNRRGQGRFPRASGQRPRQDGATGRQVSFEGQFCGLCQLANAPPRVYNSHSKDNCNRYSKNAIQAMENVMSVMSFEENPDDGDTA